jgi:hypothetical protein
VDRLTWALIAMGLLMTGMLLRATDGPGGISTAALIGAGIAFIWGMMRR